jgi:hypothetical protein
MEKILCIGDSWTDPNYWYYNWKTWPQYFENADIKALCGCSNDWIYNQFVQHHEKYDKVIILWTQWHRHGIASEMEEQTSKWNYTVSEMFKTVNYMYSSHKIRPDLFSMQGTDITGHTDIQKENNILLTLTKEFIERNTPDIPVHGWPLLEHFNGFNMKRQLKKHFQGNSWKISEKGYSTENRNGIKTQHDPDGHPNEKGQKAIYEYIKENARIGR